MIVSYMRRIAATTSKGKTGDPRAHPTVRRGLPGLINNRIGELEFGSIVRSSPLTLAAPRGSRHVEFISPRCSFSIMSVGIVWGFP